MHLCTRRMGHLPKGGNLFSWGTAILWKIQIRKSIFDKAGGKNDRQVSKLPIKALHILGKCLDLYRCQGAQLYTLIRQGPHTHVSKRASFRDHCMHRQDHTEEWARIAPDDFANAVDHSFRAPYSTSELSICPPYLLYPQDSEAESSSKTALCHKRQITMQYTAQHSDLSPKIMHVLCRDCTRSSSGLLTVEYRVFCVLFQSRCLCWCPLAFTLCCNST
jgi:hypothetical protein